MECRISRCACTRTASAYALAAAMPIASILLFVVAVVLFMTDPKAAVISLALLATSLALFIASLVLVCAHRLCCRDTSEERDTLLVYGESDYFGAT